MDLKSLPPWRQDERSKAQEAGASCHGGRTSDRQPLSQGLGCVSPLDLPGPPLHTQRTPAAPGPACLFHAPRFPCPGTTHPEPPNSSGLWASLRPPAAPGGGQQPAARNHLRRHVTSSFFLYKLSTCHPAVCFSLLRFSSNYVDFLHPTPSWKLIRLNIFIYYHFAQLLPAFPITLPASL